MTGSFIFSFTIKEKKSDRIIRSYVQEQQANLMPKATKNFRMRNWHIKIVRKHQQHYYVVTLWQYDVIDMLVATPVVQLWTFIPTTFCLLAVHMNEWSCHFYFAWRLWCKILFYLFCLIDLLAVHKLDSLRNKQSDSIYWIQNLRNNRPCLLLL